LALDGVICSPTRIVRFPAQTASLPACFSGSRRPPLFWLCSPLVARSFAGCSTRARPSFPPLRQSWPAEGPNQVQASKLQSPAFCAGRLLCLRCSAHLPPPTFHPLLTAPNFTFPLPLLSTFSACEKKSCACFPTPHLNSRHPFFDNSSSTTPSNLYIHLRLNSHPTPVCSNSPRAVNAHNTACERPTTNTPTDCDPVNQNSCTPASTVVTLPQLGKNQDNPKALCGDACRCGSHERDGSQYNHLCRCAQSVWRRS